MNKNQSRRDFLKISAGLFAAVPVIAAATQVHAADKVEMVKESDSTAVALGYKADHTKVDVKKYPKKAGADGKNQLCWNCQFYLATGDASKTKSAPCTLFQNKHVAAKGWCNSWMKKA